MKGLNKTKMKITALEKRLMLDASLGAIVTSIVFAEDTVNAAPQTLDGDVDVSGTTTDFDGESLTISTDGGAEDQLTVTNEGTGAGQIGFDGTNITFQGTLIGVASSNGTNGSNLTVDLNANATKASIERLIENLTYQNTSDAPTQDRTINIALGALFSEDIDVTVVAENDAPATTTNTGITTTEGNSVTITTTQLNATDPDNNNSDLIFNIGTASINGQLELTTNVGIAITSFSQDDLINNRVIYVHDGTETNSDSFDFTVTDGDVTLASDTFNITVTSIDDPLTLDTNTGTTVFQNLSTTIGGNGVQFGNDILRYTSNGEYSTWSDIVDNKSHQYSLIFTAPGANPTGVPGEVLFESGGSGVGVGLFLNSSLELDFYSGSAQNTPRLSSAALVAGAQYAVVIEIDQATDEIRMNYAQASNFNWFRHGRTAEQTLTGYTSTDHSGTNQTGVGQVGGGSYGGYNGSVSGTTAFQGTIDSDLVISDFPILSNTNTMLVTNDFDTADDNIIYTITSNVANGTLLKNNVALGINDTFTQSELNLGLVTYANAGGVTDTFNFDVTDGTTVLSANTFNITIDTSNVAPEILTTSTILDENFEGGATGWNNNKTSTQASFSEFLGRFGSEVNVAGNQEIFQTFATSGTQNHIVVEFDFYEIDSWDNEYFYIFVNDVNVLGNNHRLHQNTFDVEPSGVNGDVSYSVQQTTQANGYIAYNTNHRDQTSHYTLIIENSDPTLKLGFGASLNSNLSDESFGIDNLKITEVRTGGSNEQEFYIAETTANNTTIGTIAATDANAGQPLNYSITGGTGSSMFSMNTATGVITLTDNSALDFETTQSYTLDIQVTDGALSDTQTITIHVLDVMENTAPTFTTNWPFNIAEDAVNDDDVGTVVTTDLEGDTPTYSITGGNVGNAFKIDSSTGLIEVRDSSQLDSDTRSSYSLRIRVQDDNDLSLFREQTVVVNVTDVDEAPTLNIERVIEDNNAGVLYSADTGNFYKVITDNKNYSAALAFAPTQLLNGQAGHLVTITTVEEYNFIRDFASPTHIRIALSDAAEEGKWIWTAGPDAGTQISQGNVDAVGFYTRWNGSEPNSGPSNNSALMHSNGQWYDNWTGSYDSVVEWEGEDIINNDYYRINHSNADASDVNVGDSVGFVQGADPEGDSLDYSIQGGNADGIFEIDTASGEIRILDTTNIDATLQDTYVLTVRATENSGVKFDEINITIKFNDDFTISANNTLNVNEASSAIITTADLNIADLDNVAVDTRFFASTLPTYGQLEHTINPGFQISSFTLDDIQNGRISYVHDGTEITTDSFVFEVSDGGRTATGNTFNISIVNVNDAPVISVNTGTSLAEGGTVTITTAMLDSLDSDDSETELTYTASNYLNGHIEVSGTIQNTFTQDDIDNNRVVFVHNGNEGAASNFDLSLADGGEDSAVAATGTFNLSVTAVNDSPVITTNTGANVVEGAQVTITNTMLNVTDPDDSGAGLTYTLSNILNGKVELTTSPGTPVISFTQDDVDNNRVIFVHDGNENDSRFDVSVADGGEDSAIIDTGTFNLTRIPVNDSPVIGTNLGSSVNQNSVVLIKNAVLAASDPDDNGTGLTFTITGATNGQIEFVSAPNVAITSFTQDDIDNSRVLFRHSGAVGAADFDFDITDGGEDASIAASGTFNLTVDNTNDAPIISTNTGPTVLEGSTTTITTAMLDSFDPDDFGVDLTWTASNFLNGTLQVNGITQNTFTQTDLDTGLVTFIHDGSETVTARFDVSLADGGENGALAATGTFTLGITPVNEGPTLIVNDGSPNVIDLNDYTIDVFDAFQDGQGGKATSASVSADGTTLTLSGNAWKKIDIPYTLTPNTVLSFDFFTDDVSEISGIGFDNASGFGGGVFGYQLSGTQNWNGVDQSFNTYDPGDGWVRFDIPIGNDFTGAMTQLVFILDKDAGALGQEFFRNINFYEDTAALHVSEGGSFNIDNTHINSIDVDDTAVGLNFTASNLLNGHIEVSGTTQNTFTQDDIGNNRVVFVHDSSDTLNAGFDISLIDGGEDGTIAQTGNFTLIVDPVNDAPTIATNTGATMNEGGNLVVTNAMLNEADSDDDGAQLTYTASSLSNGHIEVSGTTRTTFTQDDVNKGRVVFVHDGSETLAASFAISLADGGEDGAVADTGTFNITVTPQNDSSLIVTNTGATLNEGASVTILSTMLNSADPDDTVANRTYTASSLNNGHIEVSGTTQNTFTQDDINNNRVVFVHDDSQTTTASFNISLADGLEHGATADTDTFNMTITPVNDAPTITTNAGASVNEGGNVTIINTMLNFTDPDDSSTGVTYTASSLNNGHIEVSGTTQNTFTQDDINNNRVVFVHDDSQTTTASFDISLIDGGENSVVADTDTFNISVTPINDAPTIATNTGGTIAEGGAVILSNTNLDGDDVDNADAGLIYTLTALPAGLIENTNTALTLTIGDTFTQGDIDSGFIQYTHDGGEHTSQSMSFTLTDGAITLMPATFTWTVTPVNDAPTNLGLTSYDIKEDSGIGAWIGDIYGVDADLPGDSFTFSIMSDPDSKFAIVGNQLILNSALDFEASPSHAVTIRVDDGNGATFDRLLNVNVRDVNDNPFVAPSSRSIIGGPPSVIIEEENVRDRLGSTSLILASLSGDGFALQNAFYGENSLSQILREKTTFEIREMTQENTSPEQNDPVQDTLHEGEKPQSQNDDSAQEPYTNIRQLLETLKQFESDDGAGEEEAESGDGKAANINAEFHNLYASFDDVLTYHEQRKAKLREALQ